MKKILFLELYLNGYDEDSVPKSKEPDIELLRCFTLLKKNDYDIEFIDFKLGGTDEFTIKKAAKNAEDVFINCKTYNRHFCLDIIKLLKEENADLRIFLYGQHPTYDLTFFLDADQDLFIIQKEITPFFNEYVINDKIITDLPNLAFIKDNKLVKTEKKEITDMNSLPFIDIDVLGNNYFTLYPMRTLEKHKWGFLTLSKGCPFNCVFCSQTLRISYGKTVIFFSIDESIKRIKRLLENGYNFIRFVDDDWHNKNFIRNLCIAIIKENLEFKWMSQVRADSLDIQTLRLMKKAGCECLNIGVESGSERILKILKKNETLEDIEKAFVLCKKVNINTVAYFMIGNPTETQNDLDMSFEFLKKLKPTMLQIAYFTPYPGSPFFEKLDEETKQEKSFFHYKDIVHNFSKVSNETLRKTMKKWNVFFYLNPINFWRLAFFRMSCLFFNPLRELKILVRIFNSIILNKK